jgi:hypothetical protein
MFFHFFIYNVDTSLATNFSCCLYDLLDFSVDRWESLRSLTLLIYTFLQHALTIFVFNSSIAALMKVISSAILKDFHQSLTWKFGLEWMAAWIISKSWRVYETLKHLMIHWSSGWSSEIVFVGKNTIWTFPSSMLMDWGWPGALSIICKGFNGNLSFSKYSWTSGMKRWWNHSVNNTAVTHALWLCCQKRA